MGWCFPVIGLLSFIIPVFMCQGEEELDYQGFVLKGIETYENGIVNNSQVSAENKEPKIKTLE